MKNIPFHRTYKRGSSKGRTAEGALRLGRKVDSLFKAYCERGQEPTGQGLAASMCHCGIKKLQESGYRMHDANIFLKQGPLKTFADGLGKRGQIVTVVELKTTSRSLKDYMDHYDTPCKNQPLIYNLANSEKTHHQLQLGFTVNAFRANKKRDKVTGILLIIACDNAAIVSLDEKFANPSFWDRMLTLCPITNHARPLSDPSAIPTGIPLWPGKVATATLTRLTGSEEKHLVKDRVLMLSCGAAAVATTKISSKITRRDRRTMAKAIRAVGATVGYFVHPCPTGWIVSPLQAIN